MWASASGGAAMRRVVAMLSLASSLTGCTLIDNIAIFFTPCAKTSTRCVRVAAIGSEEQRRAIKAESTEQAPIACSIDAGPPLSFAEIQPVFAQSCGIRGSCHRADTRSEATLDLAGASARELLLGDASGAERCDPKLGIKRRVVPGDPQHSMVWQVVSGSSCGPHMPLRTEPLNCDDQRRVYDWIKNGAPP
jgi:hypothetical protein